MVEEKIFIDEIPEAQTLSEEKLQEKSTELKQEDSSEHKKQHHTVSTNYTADE